MSKRVRKKGGFIEAVDYQVSKKIRNEKPERWSVVAAESRRERDGRERTEKQEN